MFGKLCHGRMFLNSDRELSEKRLFGLQRLKHDMEVPSQERRNLLIEPLLRLITVQLRVYFGSQCDMRSELGRRELGEV